MPIRILPICVSTQITAGDTIERPASVIKELLENSIDAKSKNININIENNGFKSITIQDDGNGIHRNELLLAISPHATSKIYTFSDLTNISTFGFRGEALSSIRSVSKITLISCHKNYNVGYKIYTEGCNGDIISKPIAHPIGTTVIVENLFYNMPIRLKFLKDKKSEFLKIYDVIKKIALSQFKINILFKKNNKLVVCYNKVKNSHNKIIRLNQIFNTLDINSLLTVKHEENNIKLFGWIVSPLDYLSSLKNIQYCYINNRFIYNNIVNNAVFNAYYEVTRIKSNRSFILYIHIPTNEIDINIHPTKSQINFHKSHKIYLFIYNSILNVLKKNKVKLVKCNFSIKKNLKYTIKDFYTCYFQLIKKKIQKNKKQLFFQESDYNNIFDIFLKKVLNNQLSYSHQLLIIIRKYYGLIYYFNDLILISFPLAKKNLNQYKLKYLIENNIIPKSYLVDIKFFINSNNYKILLRNQLILSKFGFSFLLSDHYINLKKIPWILKVKKLNKLISDFFSFVFLKNKLNIKEILKWFDINILTEKKPWNYLDGILLLLEIEYFCPFILKDPSFQLLQKIDIDEKLCTLKI